MEPSELSSFDLLMQLSEESGELVQAIAKLIRKERGMNPTPLTIDTCVENLLEEIVDVSVVIDVALEHLGFSSDEYASYKQSKKARWRERLSQ